MLRSGLTGTKTAGLAITLCNRCELIVSERATRHFNYLRSFSTALLQEIEFLWIQARKAT